jgi:glycosyltransferase involved in cell wall biosynthesis
MSRAQAGSLRWKHRFLPPLARRTYLMADAIVAVSEGVAQDLVAHAGVSRERITKIYNPVVTAELLVRAKEPLDHPWLKPGEPPIILGTGRLVSPKDFSTLLRAFARVRAQRKSRLIILGEGNRRNELEYLAQKLGVSNDVALPGFVANPCAYMARASVFVLSSAWEGFGNVIVEALACGCPVVSTDCPNGPSEILGDGAYGPLVPVGDDAAMADAILAILESSTESGRLQARAAEFSAERAVDDYLDVLLGTRRNRFTVAQIGTH